MLPWQHSLPLAVDFFVVCPTAPTLMFGIAIRLVVACQRFVSFATKSEMLSHHRQIEPCQPTFMYIIDLFLLKIKLFPFKIVFSKASPQCLIWMLWILNLLKTWICYTTPKGERRCYAIISPSALLCRHATKLYVAFAVLRKTIRGITLPLQNLTSHSITLPRLCDTEPSTTPLCLCITAQDYAIALRN